MNSNNNLAITVKPIHNFKYVEDDKYVLITVAGTCSPGDFRLDDLGFRSGPGWWRMTCTYDDYSAICEKIIEMGGKFEKDLTEEERERILKRIEEINTLVLRIDQFISENLGERPDFQGEFEVLNEPRAWNGRFYGKEGKWSIYIKGDKKSITDEQKAAIEKLLLKQRIWDKQERTIRNMTMNDEVFDEKQCRIQMRHCKTLVERGIIE